MNIYLADKQSEANRYLESLIEKKDKNIFIALRTSSGKELVEAARTRPAAVYVINCSLPALDGLEISRSLLELDPSSKIVVISGYSYVANIKDFFSMGVKGFVLKCEGVDEVISAVNSVYYGKYYMSPIPTQYCRDYHLTVAVNKESDVIELSARDEQIVRDICFGKSSEMTCKNMIVSPETVRVNRKR